MTKLIPQGRGIPLPEPTPLSEPFWEGCARGELRYQQCTGCQRSLFEPAAMCRDCGSPGLEWRASTGRGELYSWSVVWRPQTPAFVVPYAPAIVSLDEGHHMLSNVIGCDSDALRGGMRVAVSFHHIDGDIWLPYFSPEAGR